MDMDLWKQYNDQVRENANLINMLQTEDRKLLLRIAKEAQLALAAKLGDDMLLLPRVIESTNTDGWAVQLGKIRGERSALLELWLDNWTRAGGRKSRRFVFCLSARRNKYINVVIKQLKTEFGEINHLSDKDWSSDENKVARLIKPLPKKLFNSPIAELYRRDASWSFISFYHSAPPTIQGRKRIVSDGVAFLAQLTRSIVGIRTDKTGRDFPTEINRVAVRLHHIRERSALVAKAAKVRDAYICRVCGFNFSQRYGKLGAGFSEAHHILPLSSAKLGSRTKLDDIVTVCANCHRMLHKLKGRRKDIERLRRLLRL